MTFKVTAIVGSLRKDSNNLKLAKAIAKMGEGKFETHIARIDDLPLFNEDLEANFPAPATRLKQEVEGADAILIVTPEYNRSVPGVLKNALDWLSRPYGKNSLNGKTGAILGTSPGALGTAVAQNDAKHILNYLGVHLMTQPEVYLQYKDGLIDADHSVTNEGTQKFLQKYVDAFVAWTEKHKN